MAYRDFKKGRVYLRFKGSNSGVDSADMQLIIRLKKGFRFLLCVLIVFSKYAWVVPLKEKRSVSIVNAFKKMLNDLARKLNKIWIDKGSEFYNNSF